MGCLSAWKVLDAMIADLRGRGVTFSPETMGELRSAKTLISILLADPNCVGVSQRIEECLFNVESCIMAKAQTMLGVEYIEKWSSQLDQARRKPIEEEETWPVTRKQSFPSGLPRGPKWIRISSLPESQIDKLKEQAVVSHLSWTMENNGGLLVYGENEQLMKFIKNVASERNKQHLGTHLT